MTDPKFNTYHDRAPRERPCSWWLGLDREAFYAAAAENEPRLQRSKYGSDHNVPIIAWGVGGRRGFA